MKANSGYKVSSWIEDLQRRGRITFSLKDAFKQFPSRNVPALRNTLTRLVTKGKIYSVWQGFYAIIPVEYSSVGMIPPVLYIDDLMKYLDRPYYISLLSAAVFYGSAHQRPQEFCVITSPGSLRASIKMDVKIEFNTKREIPGELIIKKKTKTGYVNVSCPELTATDLVQYERETGGLNRVANVLNELAKELKFSRMPPSFFKFVPSPIIRRTGYLLDAELKYTSVADELFDKMVEHKCSRRVTSLKPGKSTAGYITDRKWGIIINEKIDIDE